MAITPFHSPVQSPVISMADTYVPIPFQEMAAAGAARQARIEDTLAMEDTLQSQLGQVQGINEVNLPGMPNSVFLGEQNKAQGIVAEYKQAISDLGDQLSDAASPQRRAKIRSLLTKFKYDLSPQGRLGQIQSNLAQMQEFNKRLVENPDIANNPHMIMPIVQRLNQYAMQHADGSVGSLNLNVPFGEKVDRNAKLIESLKLMGSQVLSESEVAKYSNDIPGLYAAIQESGITPERIMETASTLMLSDPEMLRDIQNQVAYENMHGADTTAEEVMLRNIAPMVGIFTQNKRNIETFKNEAEIDAIKKTNEKKLKIEALYSNPTILPKKGSGIEDVTDMENAKVAANGATKQAQVNFNKYKKGLEEQFGVSGIFEKDQNGNINYSFVDEAGIKHDFSREANKYVQAIQEAQKVEARLRNWDNELRQQAGLTDDYYNSPEFKAKYNERYAYNRRYYGRNGKFSEFEYEFATPEEKAVMDKENHIFFHNNTMNHLKHDDPKIKKYQELLKESNKMGTFVANVTPLTEDDNKRMEDNFVRANYASLLASGNLVEITNEGEKVIEEDEWEGLKSHIGNLNLSEAGQKDTRKRVQFVGYYSDDNNNGQPALLYNIIEPNGEIYKQIKTGVPVNFMDELVKNGYVNDATMYIKQDLFKEFEVFDKQGTQSSYNAGTNDSPLNVNITTGKFTADGKPKISFYTEDGTQVHKSFYSENQLVSYIASMQLLAQEKERLAKQKQNK